MNSNISINYIVAFFDKKRVPMQITLTRLLIVFSMLLCKLHSNSRCRNGNPGTATPLLYKNKTILLKENTWKIIVQH